MTFSRQLGTPTAAGEVSVEVMINGADGDRRRRSIMEAGAKMRQELFFRGRHRAHYGVKVR